MELRDRYQIELRGMPPRKNRRHIRVGGGRSINAPEFTALVAALHLAWSPRPPIARGLWRLQVTARWPRQRHLVDLTVALGDVDAPVSSIQDALQRAGVLDDDIRLVELHATKTHDAERPGVVIVLERVAEEDSP